jgi:hypothetical protein
MSFHGVQDEARDATDAELREQIAAMAMREAPGQIRAMTPGGQLGRRSARHLAFLDELHLRHPDMCLCPPRYLPHWLHQRVNDPYGTGGRHPFWESVSAERIGPWKVFERDGIWYAYETRQNAWAHFPSRDKAVEHANGPAVDIWA